MSSESRPALFAEAVTPSDVTVFDSPSFLYVGSAGDVVVRMAAKQNTVTFPSVPAGTILPVRVDQVRAATGAGGIVRMWN